MTLKQLSSTSVDFGAILGKEQDLRALLLKWLEKQLKSKAVSLDVLTLLVRTHGSADLVTLLSSVSEPTLRSLATSLDSHNVNLSSLTKAQIIDHICNLTSGASAVAPRAAKAKPSKATKSQASGTLLERSKYPKRSAA